MSRNDGVPAKTGRVEFSDDDVDLVLGTFIAGGSSARDWFLPHEHPKGLANVREVVRAMLGTALGRLVKAADANTAATSSIGGSDSVPAAARPGMVLVPLRLAPDMDQVLKEEGWQWEDFLAASDAITEEEYSAAVVSEDRHTEEVVSDLINDAKHLHAEDPESEVADNMSEAAALIEFLRRRLAIRRSRRQKQWRCFHCDEAFTDETKAREHFGDTIFSQPVCQVSPERLRELEALLIRRQEEVTDEGQAIRSLEAEHQVALRRQEEAGYARGLQDGMAQCQQPSEMVSDDQRVAIDQTLKFLAEQDGKSHQGYFGPRGWAGLQLAALAAALHPQLDLPAPSRRQSVAVNSTEEPL